MEVISESSAVRSFAAARRGIGAAPCVLVPTMGALHAGHAALIRLGAHLARSRGLGAGCIVTIFVNPTQFNEPADYARYPRALGADVELCRAAGAGAVLAPGVGDVYPPGRPVPAPTPPIEATGPGLEDAARPGHFAGVCQVVARLFEMVRPQASIFGEKDWQQFRVVAAMAWSGGEPVEIIGAPTVREADGLAMSSRNVFLSPEERIRARAFSRALIAAAGEPRRPRAEAVLRGVLEESGISSDYAVIRDAATLMPGAAAGPLGWRALLAGRVGPVRLLDNAPWPGTAMAAGTAG